LSGLKLPHGASTVTGSKVRLKAGQIKWEKANWAKNK